MWGQPPSAVRRAQLARFFHQQRKNETPPYCPGRYPRISWCNRQPRRSQMEQRVSLITLGVADLERSREFYQRLGWRRSMAKAEGVVFFQTGGMALALYPRQDLAKDANIAPEGQGFNGITLAYNTRNRAEVDSVLKEARAAGATIRRPAQEAFWGGYS